MTLEALIEENTNMLKEVAKQLHRMNQQLETARGFANETPVETKKPESKKASPSSGITKGSGESAVPSATGVSEPLSYDKDIKPRAIALSKKSMEEFKAIMAEFGVAKFPDAKPEQYAEIVEAIDKRLTA